MTVLVIISVVVAIMGFLGLIYGIYMVRGYDRKTTSLVIGLSLVMMISGLGLYITDKKSSNVGEEYVYTDSGKRKPLVPLEVEFDDEEDTIEEYRGGGENDREIGGIGEGIDLGLILGEDGTVNIKGGEPTEVKKPKESSGGSTKGESTGSGIGTVKPKEEPKEQQKEEEPKENDVEEGKDKTKEDIDEPKEEEPKEEPKEEEPKEDIEEPKDGIEEPEYNVKEKIEKFRGSYIGIASKLQGVEKGEGGYWEKKEKMRGIKAELSGVVGEIKAWKAVPEGKDKDVYNSFWEKINLSYIKIERAISEFQEDTEETRTNYRRLISEGIGVVK